MRVCSSTSIVRGLAAAAIVAIAQHASPLSAAESIEALASMSGAHGESASGIRWFHESSSVKHSAPEPPSTLAIIACRVEAQPQQPAGPAPRITAPNWRVPLECMRVIETVADAAAMTNLWLRQRQPNLADHGSCAEVAMHYAPEWEKTHRNWLIVKVGCPTSIVDANGRIIGWHMPECQGTLPGTTYPLRCRFDPSEI